MKQCSMFVNRKRGSYDFCRESGINRYFSLNIPNILLKSPAFFEIRLRFIEEFIIIGLFPLEAVERGLLA